MTRTGLLPQTLLARGGKPTANSGSRSQACYRGRGGLV